MRDLQTVFTVFDPSARGWVEGEDVRKALKTLGFKCSRRSVQEMIRDVDVKGEGRGRVDFDGFVQVVAKLQGASYDTHGEILQVVLVGLCQCMAH